MKELGSFLLGIALTIIGGFLFLNNISVVGFSGGWFSMGSRFYVGTNTITVVVVMLIISFVLMVVKPNFLTKTLVAVFLMLFVLSIILSLRFHYNVTSAFATFGILAMLFGGLGLIIRACLGIKKEDKKDKK